MKAQLKLDVTNDPLYQEMTINHPDLELKSLETILRFNKVSALITAKREALLSEYGLTSGRFHLLMLLKRTTENCLSPSELAKRTGVTRGTMTQFIDAIEKDGFVKRVDDPKDRRGMLVKLTDKGEEVIQKILPLYSGSMADCIHILSHDEGAVLSQLLDKIIDSFDGHAKAYDSEAHIQAGIKVS